MKKIIRYISAIFLIAVLAGILTYVGVRGRSGTTRAKLEAGESVDVTPTDEMRVRTAEGRPEIDIDGYRLKVEGLVKRQLELSIVDVRQMEAAERPVELHCVEGWTEKAVWKGPTLRNILARAGLEESADNVVFSSPGGYTTSLTLKEIEEADPILAYEVNGETLPSEQGFPLRLVVPGKLGYKWIKWVTGIEVISGEYEGYWESRGYDNEADAVR